MEVLDAIKSYFSSFKFSIFLMLLSLGIDITITRAFFLCFFTTTMPGWSAITSLCVYGSPTGSELSYSRSPLGAYPILPLELPGHTRHPHMCLYKPVTTRSIRRYFPSGNAELLWGNRLVGVLWAPQRGNQLAYCGRGHAVAKTSHPSGTDFPHHEDPRSAPTYSQAAFTLLTSPTS